MVVLWVRPPDLPVMVTVAVPTFARVPAARVSVVVLVAGLGLKTALVPLRNPEADSVMLWAKPFEGVMVMVVVPLAPRAMLKLVGDADRAKFGAAVTVRERDVELPRLPLTPAMVTEKVPTAALPVAVKVSELLLVVLAGWKFALTPLGRPEQDRLTLPVKPFCALMVIVVAAPVVPSPTLAAPEEAVNVKPPCGGAVAGQLFTRFAALTLPMPVAKSQPVDAL